MGGAGFKTTQSLSGGLA